MLRRAGALSPAAGVLSRTADLFIDALRASRLEILPCEGTYFLLADYSAISDLDDVSFCRWLTTEVGVAAIPLSVFCADPFPHKLIRLCFAKQPATLLAAAERLCRCSYLTVHA
jgi:methionine aminotransferase